MNRALAFFLGLAVIAVVLPTSASSWSDGAAWRGPWVGTGRITWEVNIKHVHRGNDPYGAPQTLTEVYREKAVYVLSGGKLVGGLERARMTGSGTGTAIYSQGQASTCTLNNTPVNEWSYEGPALVAISERAGKLYAVPRAVTGKVTTVWTGCSAPPKRYTRSASYPFYAAFFAAGVRGLPNADTAQVLNGKQTYPISTTALGTSQRSGTGTLTWNLVRSSKACIGGGCVP